MGNQWFVETINLRLIWSCLVHEIFSFKIMLWLYFIYYLWSNTFTTLCLSWLFHGDSFDSLLRFVCRRLAFIDFEFVDVVGGKSESQSRRIRQHFQSYKERTRSLRAPARQGFQSGVYFLSRITIEVSGQGKLKIQPINLPYIYYHRCNSI